jgi:DNA modification methylase
MGLPKPYYNDERAGIQIYLGDCREILPLLPKADLILTDPPYGIGEAYGKNKSRSNRAKAQDYGDSSWDDSPPDAETIRTVINKGTNAILWGGNYFQGLEPSPCWLVWDKDNGSNDFADCELAWTNLKKAVRKITYRWAGMLQQDMKHKEVRYHPTQKPVAVLSWAMQIGGGASIIDPFMGSGTTLRAAKDLGRKAIGIEIEERYCEIAAKRLQQEVFDFSDGKKVLDK